MKNFYYSIIIPVLNEEKNIYKLTLKIKKYCKNYNYEVIFVDDNSLDGSQKILQSLSKKFKNINFHIRKEKKKDLSASIILGIKKSKYNSIVVMDGDLQHDPKYLPNIFDIYNKNNPDFLICVRDFKKRRGLSILRYFASLALILVVNTLLHKKTSDPMSGFFIFKKKLFYKYRRSLFGKGFKFLFDILYQKNKNFKIIEYEITFKKRKNNSSKMSLRILLNLVFLIFKKLFT